MGACRVCGTRAGALKSTCDGCRKKELAQQAEAEQKLTAQLGPLAASTGLSDFFRKSTFALGEGRAMIVDHALAPDGTMPQARAVGATTEGIVFARAIGAGASGGFIPYGSLRGVFADTGYHNGSRQDGWGNWVLSENHYVWIQFHDLNLVSTQIQYPVTVGQPASYKIPVYFLKAVSEFKPVTIQDHTLQYVWDALSQ